MNFLRVMSEESTSNGSSVSEVVEAQGHLIDSHIMERIFDTVVEYGGRFQVEQFSIGRTNSDASSLRLRIEAGSQAQIEKMMTQLVGLGCSPVDSGEAETKMAERDCCAPEDFYSTTNQRTLVKRRGQWLETRGQRMDAMIVLAMVTLNAAVCATLRLATKSLSVCAEFGSSRNRRSATALALPS